MTRKTFTGDAMIDAFTPKLADMSEHSLLLRTSPARLCVVHGQACQLQDAR